MRREVTVYGFGSAFVTSIATKRVAQDVDLLIIHYGTDVETCRFAIACKRRLAASVAGAHITMLSDGEEQHCQFIRTARAVRIGSIRADHFAEDLCTLDAAISILGKR